MNLNSNFNFLAPIIQILKNGRLQSETFGMVFIGIAINGNMKKRCVKKVDF